MKLERLLFVVMIAAVLLQGTGLSAQASSASRRAPSQTSESSVNDPENDEVRNEKDQARSKEADKNQEGSAVTGTTSRHRPSTIHSKSVPSHQPHAAKTPTNRPQTDASGSVTPLEQMGSKAATNVSNKVVAHHTYIPSAVSVNGEQFRNSRDPGAHLAVSGGPLTSPRGTAAVNGTNVNHKP